MSYKKLIKPFVILAVIIFLLSFPSFWQNIYLVHILCFVCINVLLASSLRMIYRSGEVSLGTAGFMLVGGYSSAILSMNLGLSVWLTMLLGGLISAIIAFILGCAILRTKGMYFSVLTLLIAEIFRLTMWYWPSVSGGPNGLVGVPSPDPINIFGIVTITFEGKFANYYLILIAVMLCLLIMYRLERYLKLSWLAVKQSDILSESIGIKVFRHKLIVFAIACFFTGIAGALFAHYMHVIECGTTGKFGMMTSIYVLLYMVVGGEASFAGPILGASIFTSLPELFRPLKEYQPIIFGILVILVMFFMRQGLIGLPNYFRSWWRKGAESIKKARGEG